MKELVEKYRDINQYDLSCSEAIIYAANDKYNLNLSKDALKMMAPFSGGMYEKDTCGIITGSLSVLGIMLTDKNSHNSPILQEAVLEYKKQFREVYDQTDCEYLYSIHRKEFSGCNSLITKGGVILENVINKYLSKKMEK